MKLCLSREPRAAPPLVFLIPIDLSSFITGRGRGQWSVVVYSFPYRPSSNALLIIIIVLLEDISVKDSNKLTELVNTHIVCRSTSVHLSIARTSYNILIIHNVFSIIICWLAGKQDWNLNQNSKIERHSKRGGRKSWRGDDYYNYQNLIKKNKKK